MDLVKRAEFGWGASGASYAKPTKGLVIHYDGSNQGLATKAHSACVTYWQNTRKFHMGPSRKWRDIGYSWGACPHGYVFEGRGLNKEQAAQPNGNTTYYSCTLMGGPKETPTTAQIEAVRALRDYLMDRGVAGAVKGHRDFTSTSCPGDIAYRMVKDGTFAKEPSAPEPPNPPKPDPKPQPTAPPYPGKALRYPPLVKSAGARTWQTRMRGRGWDIEVDGFYGKQSKAICEAFQAEKGLGVDGVVGPKTWAATWSTPIT